MLGCARLRWVGLRWIGGLVLVTLGFFGLGGFALSYLGVLCGLFQRQLILACGLAAVWFLQLGSRCVRMSGTELCITCPTGRYYSTNPCNSVYSTPFNPSTHHSTPLHSTSRHSTPPHPFANFKTLNALLLLLGGPLDSLFASPKGITGSPSEATCFSNKG